MKSCLPEIEMSPTPCKVSCAVTKCLRRNTRERVTTKDVSVIVLVDSVELGGGDFLRRV